MRISRRSFLAGAAAGCATAPFPQALLAQPSNAPSMSALQADFELLRRAYESVHPGLTRYLPPGGFAARIAAATRWAERDRSLGEMFLMLSRVTAAVRCGHSYPNPNNQRRTVRAALFEGRDRVPFSFRWLGGRMIVTGSRGGATSLEPGTEVLAVDGETAGSLLRTLLPLTRADGANDAKRIDQLGVDARERYAAFDIFRPLIGPTRTGEQVRVRILARDGIERSMELRALTEAEVQHGHADDDAQLGWRFHIGTDRIGRLVMPTWVAFNSQWNWRGFIDDAVDRLISERARGLIVDIRGNGGGSDCGTPLLERLVGRDTQLPRFTRKVRYRALPDSLTMPLDTWDDSFRNWGSAAIGPDGDGFYRLRRDADDDADILRPRGRRFAGRTVVLADAACSSATFQFANDVRTTGIATLVGEPTGGNRRGINGGAFFFVRLPGSGLEVDLPVIGLFSDRRMPDMGVMPDVRVPVRAEDIAAGRDPQMAAALRLMDQS